LFSSSAVGYYGAITSEHIFTETDLPGNDFLAHTCKLWEQSADQFSSLGIRTVKIRTGVVIGKSGGIISKLYLVMANNTCLGFTSPIYVASI
jgi:NAD dependent epimerase/dehydratase family enzyme